MPQRRKAICIIPSMKGGGAEKVMLTLLEHFSRDKFELTLVLFEKKGEYLDLIPAGIRVLNLHKKGKIDFLGLINRLASVFRQEKPHVILSFLWYANVITILAKKLSMTHIPVILTVQNFMSKVLKDQRWGWIKQLMVRLLFPSASRVATVSKGVADDLVKNFKVSLSHICIIPNPIDIKKIKKLSSEELHHPWFDNQVPVIVSAGRLNRQKGFPLLLKAFARLQKEIPLRLIILGEGEERPTLESLISKLQLNPWVQLPGFIKNPYPYIKNSSIYVMTSLYEGFPVAMLEAMACGIPIVSTDCPSGPDEIITDGFNGLLVPVSNESELCSAISKILKDKAFGKRLSEKASLDIEKYSINQIVGKYEELMDTVV